MAQQVNTLAAKCFVPRIRMVEKADCLTLSSNLMHTVVPAKKLTAIRIVKTKHSLSQ